MELRALRAFAAVVRSGGFTTAAEQLNVTQPSISKLIQQLESELGETLLQRSSRNVVLTTAGEIVLGYVDRILDEADQIGSALDDLKGLQRGVLRIGIPPLGPNLFVPMISAYKLRYPHIELKLFEDGSKAIEQALLNRELDLGGLLAPVTPQIYHHHTMINDQLALVSPSQSCWKNRPEVKLAELAEEPFIMFSDTYLLNHHIIDACHQQGFSPEIVGRSGQISFILELVSNGVGIALLPSSALAQFDTRNFSLSTLIEPVIPWRIDLAWLKNDHQSSAQKQWLALLETMSSNKVSAD